MSTDALALRDRSEWYIDLISREVAPTRLVMAKETGFHARAGSLDLGAVRAVRFSYGAHRAWRTPALIRRSDPGEYALALISRGVKRLSQNRGDVELRAGDAVLFDTSRPFEAETASRRVQAHILRLPRAVIPLPPDKVDRLLARRLDVHRGVGAFLARFITTLDSQADHCGPAELGRLGAVAVDLASGLIAHHLDAHDELPGRTRKHLLLRRIDTFIDGNLGDPGLTPGAIAAHHHLSVRHLYALFQERGESVSASVRRRRLEQCRAELARTAGARPGEARPVHVIAARWGFTSAVTFSRAFRNAYGTSPTEYRQEAGDQVRHRTPDRGPDRTPG
ncbi:hypothetical protein AB852_14030 [Streptomyces uncialis]|uniref:HTH araC/xylS-type domain-containing protein n=1 Tax=Streptomyces uncialis TaxID=1048205 RepID=A0A1Q4V946_9ACTN|nr:hypothetical protein AB852_14030 [Streptomyces uncialis]